MKNVLDKVEKRCLFERKSNCSILKTKECLRCKFFVKDTPENHKKYIEKIKKDIKNYALKHNQ